MVLTKIDKQYILFLLHQKKEKELLFQFQKDIYHIFNRKYQ
jgi:hypothetical protein